MAGSKRGGEGVARAEADAENHCGGGERAGGGGAHGYAPVEPAEGVDEVRRGRAEGEAADQQADHEAHVGAAGPARRELHADRIDAGERDPGQEAADEVGDAAGREQQDGGVDERPQQRRCGKHATRIEPVGQRQPGAQKGSEHEAGLHRGGEPGLEAGHRAFGVAQQAGPGDRPGEPQRQRQDLGQRDQQQVGRFAARLHRSDGPIPRRARQAGVAGRCSGPV